MLSENSEVLKNSIFIPRVSTEHLSLKHMAEVESLNSMNNYLVFIFLTSKLSLAKINFTEITIKRYI